MRYLLALISGLALLWLILSGHDTPLALGLGAGSCLFIVGLCYRLELINDEAVPIQLLPRLLVYTPWLLTQIVRSTIDITWRLLAPRRFIDPNFVEREFHQRTDLGRAIFANSVTLAPGTVTVGLEGGRALIHSLKPLTEGDINDSEMDRRVRWLEGKG